MQEERPDLILKANTIANVLWRELLEWWATYARNFPWRNPAAKAYEILVAEFLLKRTTAAAAERAYSKIIRQYPDIALLANVNIHTLTDLINDIGLQNQRAKALSEAAQYIQKHYNGAIPKSAKALLSIPHVGMYTMKALQVFAFGYPVGVVDANVQRVFTRILAGRDQPKISLSHCQSVAEILVPTGCAREYNWALLDFSAIICRYNHPLCNKCALTYFCEFYRMKNRASL